MTETQKLIDAWWLARRRCAGCARRWCGPLSWLALAGVILACSRSVMACGRDLAEHLHQPVFVVSIVAALATGDRSRPSPRSW